MTIRWYKNRLVVGIIVLFISVCIIPSSGIQIEQSTRTLFYTGNVLYVGGSGEGNYTKIQDAIDNASEGNTVFVFDDSSPYNEDLTVNKAIFLCGENRQTTKINGKVSLYSQNDVHITKFTINIITIERSSYITIIDNDIINEDHGVKIVDCSDFKIINNNITDQDRYGIEIITSHSKGFISGNKIVSKSWSSPNYACIRLRSANDITISDNTFISLRDSLYSGIRLEISEDNTINNNIFIDTGLEIWVGYYENNIYNNTVNGKPLIYLNGVNDKTVDNAGQVFLVHCKKVTVCNSSISKVPCGITLYNTEQCTISNNIISGCSTGISSNYAIENTFSKNILKGCSFHMSKGSNNIITENTLQNTRSGIYLSGSRFNTLMNNNISSCNGIMISASMSNKIINNQIKDCSIGIEFDTAFFNTIKQNNFINNKNAFFVMSFFNHWAQNYWGEPKYSPYKIHGYLYAIMTFPDEYTYYIPMTNYDWNPAQEPYDI